MVKMLAKKCGVVDSYEVANQRIDLYANMNRVGQ